MEIGVRKAAKRLDVAVRETERAVFARPNRARIFETLPPGQQLTKIIPRATLGIGWIRQQRPRVISGKPMICPNTPAK